LGYLWVSEKGGIYGTHDVRPPNRPRRGGFVGKRGLPVLAKTTTHSVTGTSGANAAVSRHNDEGLLAYQQGQWESARQHFEAAITASPELAEAHYNLGMVLYRLGALSEGYAHFIKAANLAPGDKIIWNSPPLAGVLVPEKESKMPGHGGGGHSH
jgi:tetratricopeptide (TPR) repeat protein